VGACTHAATSVVCLCQLIVHACMCGMAPTQGVMITLAALKRGSKIRTSTHKPPVVIVVIVVRG